VMGKGVNAPIPNGGTRADTRLTSRKRRARCLGAATGRCAGPGGPTTLLLISRRPSQPPDRPTVTAAIADDDFHKRLEERSAGAVYAGGSTASGESGEGGTRRDGERWYGAACDMTAKGLT